MDESVSLSGLVEHIVYSNKNNGYTVFDLQSGDESVVCVGIAPDLKEGENVTLKGEYTFHTVYGNQFKFQYVEVLAPEGTAAILRYLSSGMIKGVGPSTARSIVERFGEKTLEVIENDYERLSYIKGISLAKAKKISDAYKSQNGYRDVVMQLSEYKINAEEAAKIYKYFGKEAVDRVKLNPFCLYNDELGFSFQRVCELAILLKIPQDSEHRVQASIKHVLQHNLLNGHTCLPLDKLTEISMQFLSLDRETISNAITQMQRGMIIRIETICNKDFVFLLKYYTAERYIASKLKIMSGLTNGNDVVSKSTIKELEKEFKIVYQDKQVEAINSAINKGLLVLTGGPGTGKTTTLKAIIKVLSDMGMQVLLAAPTGRAAKRMSELTGEDAKTIHRLLEVEWDENDQQTFAKNERNPIDCDCIIVDEMSMVDSLLFESLLRALPLGCRVIMVGDSDQLPSVGAGNVLADIISSGVVPVVTLTEVFRQALSSLIIANAHSIVNGIYPQLDIKDNDMFMIDLKDRSKIADYIVNLCTTRLPKAYGYNPLSDIQILCPSKKTVVGTSVLNNLLQSAINKKTPKSSEDIVFKNYTLRVGDKVMQIKNNYDIEWVRNDSEYGSGVFNGDIGIFRDINITSGKITVEFDDKIAFYSREDANQLELSYAATVHKSQGSEFDCVILPLFDTPEKLCYRNLLYTAVTRAKKHLILVGDRDIVIRMTDNNRKSLRYSGLEAFLKE